MPGAYLNAVEMAAEFGRKPDWIYANWREMAKAGQIPQPMHGGATPLVWNRAQVYAFLDQQLPDKLQPVAAAYRAAVIEVAETITAAPEAAAVQHWRAALEERYGA